ncbi:hypothetical protein LFT44_20845 (plasmid) [Arthrobacter sp. FW306-05-C]|uniref:hypothetical protein n=1 Tax=Micrococcaceae TaxID=1268 RepID=UPI001F25C734|nr:MULTISPECIES: hypothetical protein [Micrococcaceae]MDE8671065.1 hypothetical protein [Pseudarthrobacter sp. H3Y2-7]MDP9989415.1 hydroxylamine reductase (hybrid-cluster protein) [Arthrobacter oryzae]UKA68982.1 hypothetical protein LFT44_20845 [Arthrobacter sp. FW306-05-C]
MNSQEYRAGETTYGPLELKSIWKRHELRNFDLMVILQVSGGEHAAQRILRDEEVSAEDKASLAIANDLAKQKGYLPLFDLADDGAEVSEGQRAELEEFFESEEWETRNQSSTRNP